MKYRPHTLAAVSVLIGTTDRTQPGTLGSTQHALWQCHDDFLLDLGQKVNLFTAYRQQPEIDVCKFPIGRLLSFCIAAAGRITQLNLDLTGRADRLKATAAGDLHDCTQVSGHLDQIAGPDRTKLPGNRLDNLHPDLPGSSDQFREKCHRLVELDMLRSLLQFVETYLHRFDQGKGSKTVTIRSSPFQSRGIYQVRLTIFGY